MIDKPENGHSLDAPPDGLTSPPKMEHEGKDYDYVFQIDVKDDEPPIPLPFNREGKSRLFGIHLFPRSLSYSIRLARW